MTVVDDTVAPPEAASSVVLRAVDITKSFDGLLALKGVNFDIRAGAVTVLFGENGAGKSTLMKILAGVYGPTTGHLELDGEEVAFKSTTDAAAHRIAIIHQELSLCPNLSVRDNIFLGREVRTRRLFVDDSAEEAASVELLARLEERLPPKMIVENLRLGQQQVVEIARALAGEARVLIMDEPTSALSASEVEILFGVIEELTAAGVAIVYISHHLEEALEIADHVVVFRDGALVDQAPADEIDIEWVISRMVGREAHELALDFGTALGDPVLSLRDVEVVDPSNPGRLAVAGVSVDVRGGELVCLYGLMGAGRTELLEAVAGKLPVARGTVALEGRTLTDESIAARIDLGLALVPEDRQRDGLVQTMSVGHNLSLASLLSFVRRRLTSSQIERTAVARSMAEMHVKAPGPQAPITSLSGGNQQKVVIGRALMTKPRALLLDEPTRGIDVGAKSEIFSLMADEARRGLAVLFATSEIHEALTMSNRIIVLSKGAIVGEFDPRTATKDAVMIASGEAEVDASGNVTHPGTDDRGEHQ